MDLIIFFEIVRDDPRIAVSHISLYLALRSEWELQNFPSNMVIDRERVMRSAKIGGKSTYFGCLHDLHIAGYVCYKPAMGCAKSKLSFRRLG